MYEIRRINNKNKAKNSPIKINQKNEFFSSLVQSQSLYYLFLTHKEIRPRFSRISIGSKIMEERRK